MANDEDDDQKDTNSFHMIARMQIIASCLQSDMVNKFLCISSTLHFFSVFFGKSHDLSFSRFPSFILNENLIIYIEVLQFYSTIYLYEGIHQIKSLSLSLNE